MRLIQVRASELGWRLFRNQVGHYELKDGRRITSGLAKGSADLIGWRETGYGVAQFVSVEVKSERGKLTEQQEAWLRAVKEAGGHAIVARSPDDLT
jgi:hypothetical protein